MKDADRVLLANALPRLRGYYMARGERPALSWKNASHPGGQTIDLGQIAEAGVGDFESDLPATLCDRERHIEVSVSRTTPRTFEKPMSGRVMAVTGAGSGIGREIARVFANAGATVAALDVDCKALADLEGELGCLPVECDVTDDLMVAAAFDEVAASCGGLDILITNAGAAWQGAIADVQMADLQRSFDLNFYGHQRCCQAAVRLFRKQDQGGLILFNISNQSVNPGRHFGAYGIPKAAAMALMKQYAVDHSREGIRVSGINAGRIRTGLLTDDVIRQRADARGISTDQYMSGNLLGVEVTAKDVASAFLHLALLDKVNAAVLTVDAGDMATSLR
jgi:NAD(P)-dependent dehydrogenase (short-subunit alcohol dehydrogenase family)